MLKHDYINKCNLIYNDTLEDAQLNLPNYNFLIKIAFTPLSHPYLHSILFYFPNSIEKQGTIQW